MRNQSFIFSGLVGVFLLVTLSQHRTIQKLDREVAKLQQHLEGIKPKKSDATERPPRENPKTTIANLFKAKTEAFHKSAMHAENNDDTQVDDDSEENTTQEKLAELQSQVDSLLSEAVLDDDKSKDRLRTLFRIEQDSWWEQRQEERRERRQKHQDIKIQNFSSTANLSESQQEDLSILLKSERKSIREAFALARLGTIPWPNAIQKAEILKTSTEEEAKEILDEEQFEQFENTFGNRRRTSRHEPRRF